MLILFHNLEFLFFFLPVLLGYWVLPGRWRNAFLLAASYGFYASWNWRFLGCIVASTLVDYFCGLGIHRSDKARTRKLLLTLSVTANLGMLGFFKYCNFFIESVVAVAGGFGITLDAPTLHVILPIGISFYTFQTMSYSIDIFRRKIEPTVNIVDFGLFVIFFPQLIAGPIEKARDLLPQLQAPKVLRSVDWRRGVYLFAYGWFLKVAIADPVGHLVNDTFGSPASGEVPLEASGAGVLLAIYGYAIQIYCDFSGYSKMARGLACLFGVRLSRNFYMPFFSRGYVDFYKRWHITLSNWIGEYVYMPLYYHLPRTRLLAMVTGTGARLYLSATLALLTTRIIFGLWHGASVGFVLLGFFIYFGQLLSLLAHNVTKSSRTRNNRLYSAVARPLQSLFMIHMFAYAMLLFRAKNLEQIRAFSWQLVTDLDLTELLRFELIWVILLPVLFIGIYDWIQFRADDEFVVLRQSGYRQLAFWATLFTLWVLVEQSTEGAFIYFQF